VNSDVEPKEVNESGVLREAQEVGQVPGVILVQFNSRELALTVDVTVDATSNVRKLGDALITY